MPSLDWRKPATLCSSRTLEAIKTALGQAMSQESVTLTNTEEDITRRLLRTTDPAEMLMLTSAAGDD